MSVRVYEYGLLPPTLNSELVEQQLRDAHRYRNMLTEIERERRTKVRSIMASHQDMAPLQERISQLTEARDQARDAVKKKRAESRSRSESKAERDAIKDITAQIREVVLQVKDIRSAVAADPTVQFGLKETDAAARQRVRDERAKCGVYWGTYLLQEADADRARQETSMPKFEPYRGNGRVSVQLQGGLELPDLWGRDTQIQIAKVNPDAYNPIVRRGERRRAGRTVVRLRVGSLKAKPVWAEWPMIMHRPLPEGSVIKVATVLRRKRDCVSWYWRLQLTVDTSACLDARRPSPERGAVALNLGFCVRPGGVIRSGFLLGSDGWSQEVLAVKSDIYRGKPMTDAERARAEQWIANGIRKSEDIRSIRDNNLNLMKAVFAPWRAKLLDQPGDPGALGVPEQPVEAGHSHGRQDELGRTPGPGDLDQDQPEGSGLRRALLEQPGDRRQDVMKTTAGSGHTGSETSPAGTGPDREQPAVAGLVHDQEQPGDPGHALHNQDWLGNTETLITQEQPAIAGRGNATTQEQPAGAGPQVLPQEQPADAGPAVPIVPGAWFEEATKSVSMWLSAARFRALSLRWQNERFPGDEEGFELLLAWRDRDEHLERYEAGIRGSALRDRLETYRIIAAQVAKRYRTLIVDGTDLSRYQSGGEVEDEKKDHDALRRNQRLAAGSLLRGALMNAFGPERIRKMPPAKRTTTCHSCSAVNVWDRTVAATRIHTCSHCGVQWDIDANFCRNLLVDWTTEQLEPTAVVEEPKKPSRSERLRAAASTKVKERTKPSGGKSSTGVSYGR